MVEEPAGGSGGDVTSMATRVATQAEVDAYHNDEVARAQALLDEAKRRHDEHVKQKVIIGAPPPPGPLDPNSVVAQGVGNPGADNSDGRLGVPLGGHTAQQGQPSDPVSHGVTPPKAPEPDMTPPFHGAEPEVTPHPTSSTP